MSFFSRTPVGALVIVFALSFHGILEGLALGTQLTTRTYFLTYVAIAAHLPLGSFALGVAMVKARAIDHRLKIRLVGLFVGMCPTGVLVGALLSAYSGANTDVLNGVCSAVAGGTFLYIGAEEILPKEMGHNAGDKPIKLLCLLLGFALMAGIKAMPGG